MIAPSRQHAAANETRGGPSVASGGAWFAGAVTCALAFALAGCQIRRPIVRLHDIDVAAMDFRKIDLVFEFEVTNPNGFGINLSGFEYAAAAAGETFATGALAGPLGPLKARQTRIVRAPLAIEYARCVPIVRRFRAREPIPYELSAKATFRVLWFNVGVPLRHTGKIPPLRAPRWRLRRPRLLRDPPGIELVFEVDNPNSFELGIAGLNGKLTYGGEVLLRVDQPAASAVGPGATGRIAVPVRLDTAGAIAAVMKVLGGRKELKFDGELRLKAPTSLRELLLGRTGRDE